MVFHLRHDLPVWRPSLAEAWVDDGRMYNLWIWRKGRMYNPARSSDQSLSTHSPLLKEYNHMCKL